MSEITMPKTRMTKEQSNHAMKILNSGNVLLRKWSVYDKKKCARLFRNAIFEGQTNPRNVIPENLMPEFDCDRVVILAAKKTTFEDGRTVEEADLQNYAGIAEKLAHRLKSYNNTFEFSDFVQEGYMQIIECMYSWLAKFEVEMSTFIYCSIKRRYSKLINTGNLFCPLTNSDIDLILQYQSIKEKSNYSTFDEIVSKMELDYEQSINMSRLFCKIVNQSQIECRSNHHYREDNSFGNDYTHLSVESHNDVNATEQNEYVKNIISKANLTPLENELIHIAMESHKAGWQSEFAKTHVSPKTGKPYSRMRITQILESAREKIRKAM